MNSWGVYLVAAAALVLILSPALSSASRDSREGVDLRNAEGVRAVLSSLGPGVTARIYFSGPGSDPLTLAGGEISASYGGGTVALSTGLSFNHALLQPGVRYLASVAGGEVVVTKDG